MKVDPNATDRVVVVGSGFGVWQGGRHIASARWGDVVRVRGRKSAGVGGGAHVRLSLRDGSDVLVTDALPGYRSFLKVAESSLPGMQSAETWMGTAQDPSDAAGEEIVLFERARR